MKACSNRVFALRVFAFVVLILFVVPVSLIASSTPEHLADVSVSTDMIAFQPVIAHSQVRVTLTGPDGFTFVKWFAAGASAEVDFPSIDGLYKYELRFAPDLGKQVREDLAAARRAGTEPVDSGSEQDWVQSGSFAIADGRVVEDLSEIEPKVVLTNSDGVIRNSLCVGFDCPDAPAFGDSTMLMMENNTRIKFGDTSNSPFPANDWEIEANSASSGGANYLGFNDCGSADNDGGCATDLVFAVEAGARQSALYVESDGDIGVGTSNPVADIHVVTGNSPTLRLDQDGSSGFTPQVWDVAGNETNFFVRDTTNGSRLPLRIRPGASSNSIFIDSDADVGIGTASPDARLDIESAGAGSTVTGLRLTNTNGPSRLEFRDDTGSVNWDFRTTSGDTFVITKPTSPTNDFLINSAGNVTIRGTLVTGGGGTCDPGPCDGVFVDYPLESIEEHSKYMWENQHLWGVGPTPEGQPLNLSKKTTGILHELEKAHIYIEQLNNEVKSRDAVIAALAERLSRIEKLVEPDL